MARRLARVAKAKTERQGLQKANQSPTSVKYVRGASLLAATCKGIRGYTLESRLLDALTQDVRPGRADRIICSNSEQNLNPASAVLTNFAATELTSPPRYDEVLDPLRELLSLQLWKQLG